MANDTYDRKPHYGRVINWDKPTSKPPTPKPSGRSDTQKERCASGHHIMSPCENIYSLRTVKKDGVVVDLQRASECSFCSHQEWETIDSIEGDKE